jgi:hypothetical protein
MNDTEPNLHALRASVLFEGAAPAPGAPVGARVTPEPTPLEASAVARAVQSAWYWPEAGDVVRGHAAHVDVALAAEVGTPIERALALTKAAAAVAAQPGAVAVFWHPTGMVHSPEQWMAQVEDATEEDLPLPLWLAFEGTEKDDGTRSLYTSGMRALGAMEVEVPASKRDGEEVLETVCDVALFVLTSPVPLEDGDQVEVTRGKVRVRIEPSARNDGTRAYRLRLP